MRASLRELAVNQDQGLVRLVKRRWLAPSLTLTFSAIGALSAGEGAERLRRSKPGKLTMGIRRGATERPTRVPRCCVAVNPPGFVGGCMEIDRASAQRIVARLGVTLGFLFLLAIIALAFP